MIYDVKCDRMVIDLSEILSCVLHALSDLCSHGAKDGLGCELGEQSQYRPELQFSKENKISMHVS